MSERPTADDPAADETPGERFGHAIASPLTALRMYGQTLADLMPALLAAHDRSGEVAPIPPEYRRVLAVIPERLLRLADEIDRISRRYRTDLAAVPPERDPDGR